MAIGHTRPAGDAAHRAPATLIASVQRALRLLEATSAAPNGAPAKQLARKVSLPLSTTYHLLRTLTFEGYLRRLPDGTYIMGDEIGRLLEPTTLQAVISRSRPALTALRDTARAAAYLAFYDDGEIVVRDIEDGPRARRIDLWVGFREAAHATALGKCVLAHLDSEASNDYMERHPLHDLTARTITRRQTLERSLRQVRIEGMAVDDEEYLAGTACVAAPVTTARQIGAVAVSLPRGRLVEVGKIRPLLRRTADRIARSYAIAGA